MPPQLGQTQYLQRNVNGNNIYQTMAYGGNTPEGYNSISKDDYVSGLQSKLSDAQNQVTNGRPQGYVGVTYGQNDINDFQNQISQAQSNQGIHAQGYRDPSFSQYDPNAPTPSEQYYTQAYRSTLAPAEQQRLNSTYGQSNPVTPLVSGQSQFQVGNSFATAPTSAIAQSQASQQPTGTPQTQQPPANPFSTTLQQGSNGGDVVALQKMLGITPDGIYGPQTAAAVKAYQQQNGLTADGIFGPQTSSTLSSITNAQGANPTVTSTGQTISPNASLGLTSGSAPVLNAPTGSLSTSDVMAQQNSYQNTINGYLKQQADAYAALQNTKATALQGQANIMYGQNGAGGSDASLQGTEQAQFDRQMAFKTVPAQIALGNAQNALELFKQSPAYLTETQARDTAFNMLQNYGDINYAYNPNLSAQQNLQNIKQALPSSAKYQASLYSLGMYTDSNGINHTYYSKGPNIAPGGNGGSAPTPHNPSTSVGNYVGSSSAPITTTSPIVDNPVGKTQVTFVEDWNNGQLGTSKNALNTAIGHLFEANTLFSKLGNGNYPLLNSAKNKLQSFQGSQDPSNYETAQSLASDELANAYGGNSVSDRQSLSQYGGANQSPGQHTGYISTATSLLASKVGALSEQYKGAFGHYPSSLDSILSPLNQVKLSAFANTNLNGIVPGVAISPSTQAMINTAQVLNGKIYLPDANGNYNPVQ